jgi:hypothetical protein
MKYRKLRISWSLFWGVACLLVIVLWVRSYWARDAVFVTIPFTGYFQFDSSCGAVQIFAEAAEHQLPKLEYTSQMPTDFGAGGNHWYFYLQRNSDFRWLFVVVIPNWYLVPPIAALATLPWLPWSKRFSLRTLLIATTLVAAGLGLAVYTLRQ